MQKIKYNKQKEKNIVLILDNFLLNKFSLKELKPQIKF